VLLLDGRKNLRESAEDLESLQALLDRSIEQAGSFLRESFQMPEHSLSALQLVGHLDDIVTVALATVTATGEPRVAPTGALFYRGRFYIPTVAGAARTRHVRTRPLVSLTHYTGNGLAVIVHGRATIIPPGQPEFDVLESLHRELAGVSVREWGEGVYLQVDPDMVYTYAREPKRYRA
jgi:nitroimidazol reductase NimA-like FMN-containing flavoprotein (pyridoxamine 5'-phosphate oxidase superfamily)